VKHSTNAASSLLFPFTLREGPDRFHF
jgi:hypothetical protein